MFGKVLKFTSESFLGVDSIVHYPSNLNLGVPFEIYEMVLNDLQQTYPDSPSYILLDLCFHRVEIMLNYFPGLAFNYLDLVNSFIKISGETYLFIALFIVFCYSLFNSKNSKYFFPLMQTNTIYISILTLILTIFILSNQNSVLSSICFDGNLKVDNLVFFVGDQTHCLQSIHLQPASTYIFNVFQNHFVQSEFYFFLKEFLLFIVIIIFLLGLTYTRFNNFISYEFSILLLLSTWAMCLLISSTDLISIYLIIELQSFCFYILTATKSNSNFSTEAGLKYFILGSFSSGLLLFGISILYGFTGLTNLDELRILFSNIDLTYNINSFAIVFALLLILIGILFKFGLVPFHMYVPDVYTGAPSIVTTLFLVIQKFVILIVYVNLYNCLFINFFSSINYLLIFSIIASIILGSVTALSQSKIKRLVAYSAIVNGGYLLLGVAVGTIDGLSSSLLFLFIYITLIITLFTIYLGTTNQYNNNKLSGFKDFILLKKGNVMLAISFALVLFSIAGIPPLAGFYGKLFLFTSVIKEGSYALALIAIIFTVVTAYYYIRLIKIMFFEKVLRFGFFNQIGKRDAYIISIGTMFNLVFFLMPKLFFVFINTLVLKFYFFL